MTVRRYEMDAGTKWLVEWHAKVTSTNNLAHKLDAHEAYRVIVADYQTHGRGQHGRRWNAPPGENILATFCVPAPRKTTGGVRAMVAALAVRNVLSCNGLHASLKWPNDIFVNGAKIAGVLIEAKPHRLIVGVGLNVHWPPTRLHAEGSAIWTSMLAETGQRFDREALVQALGREVFKWYSIEAHEVLKAYRQWWLPPEMEVRVRRGHEWVRGFVQDVNHDASIRILTHDGDLMDIHSSADIRHRNS